MSQVNAVPKPEPRKKRRGKIDYTKRIRRATDEAFSLYIRSRDEWTCRICESHHRKPEQMIAYEYATWPSDQLHCSHFFARSLSYSVRWCMVNADALCFQCHNLLEHLKAQGEEYYQFKWSQLGPACFRELELRARHLLTYTPDYEMILLHNYIDLLRQNGEKMDWFVEKYAEFIPWL